MLDPTISAQFLEKVFFPASHVLKIFKILVGEYCFCRFAPAGQLREICWAESAILLVALHAALLKVCEFVQLEQSILKLSMLNTIVTE